jgi:hypothetical protein
MSHEERNTLTETLANMIIIAVFVWLLSAGHAQGRFDGPAAVQIWSIMVLQLIGLSIVIGIVAAIVMAVVWRSLTGETANLMRDERDKAIAGIGWRIRAVVMGAGVVVAVIALALEQPVITALNLILAGCALGDTAGNLAKLYAYRRGV